MQSLVCLTPPCKSQLATVGFFSSTRGRKDRAPWECLGSGCSWWSLCRAGIGEPIFGDQLITESVLWETRKLQEREYSGGDGESRSYGISMALLWCPRCTEFTATLLYKINNFLSRQLCLNEALTCTLYTTGPYIIFNSIIKNQVRRCTRQLCIGCACATPV